MANAPKSQCAHDWASVGQSGWSDVVCRKCGERRCEPDCESDRCPAASRPARKPNAARGDEVADLVYAVCDFLSYFDPRGGISDVPLGPFERARETLAKHGHKTWAQEGDTKTTRGDEDGLRATRTDVAGGGNGDGVRSVARGGGGGVPMGEHALVGVPLSMCGAEYVIAPLKLRLVCDDPTGHRDGRHFAEYTTATGALLTVEWSAQRDGVAAPELESWERGGDVDEIADPSRTSMCDFSGLPRSACSHCGGTVRECAHCDLAKQRLAASLRVIRTIVDEGDERGHAWIRIHGRAFLASFLPAADSEKEPTR